MLGALVTTPFLLAAAGAVTERFMRRRDRRRFPLPDLRQDVGGHQLHYALRGRGDPLIVLEADAGEWSTHWGELADRLARSSQVLTYDRAGLGWSEAGPEPRTVDTLARELHQLLVRVAEGRRFLLVGHGAGAGVVRMYAHRYPFETAGMVLLDPPHEGLWDVLRHNTVPLPGVSPLILRLCRLGNAVGLLRASRLRPTIPILPDAPLAPRALDALTARGHEPAVLSAILAEELARPSSEAQLARLRDRFEVPVRVLVAGSTLLPISAPKGYPIEDFNRLWVDQASAFEDLSSDTRISVLENAHHHLPLGSSDAVLQAVLEVVEAVRVPAQT